MRPHQHARAFCSLLALTAFALGGVFGCDVTTSNEDSTAGAAGSVAGGSAAQGGSNAGTTSLAGTAPEGGGLSSGGGVAGGGGGNTSSSGGDTAAGGVTAAGADQGGSATGGRAMGDAGGGGAPTGGMGGGSSGGTASSGGGGGAGGKLTVWLAGDSTVQKCSSPCPCGWGSRFDELFDDRVTVVNSAVGGRSVMTWLYEGAVSTTKDGAGECSLTSNAYNARWTSMLDAASGMKAGDYLFVQFGINDSTSECPRHVGIEKFKSQLAYMAKEALARGATPILLTPTSAIECSGSNPIATRGAFVDATKAAATASGALSIDLHALTMARYKELGFCPNDENYASGKLGDFFCEDHTHFESAGAADVAKLVASAIKTAKLPLASYLRL